MNNIKDLIKQELTDFVRFLNEKYFWIYYSPDNCNSISDMYSKCSGKTTEELIEEYLELYHIKGGKNIES